MTTIPTFSSQADLGAPAFLVGLNDPQRAAVLKTDGPVLVLSGAGTGKTRVLTTRLAYLLQTHRAYPSQILAVTFTNKAAAEMKDRVARIIGGPVEGWWLGTFHALAARMLRSHAEKVGLTQGFTIIDQDDQTRLIKQLLEAEQIDTKKWPAQMVASVISRWKDKAWTPADVPASEVGDMAGGKLLQIYRFYQDRLRTVNAVDFGDLLLHMIWIMKNPDYVDVLRSYQQKFKYIMVDEYQDTNTAQYLWLRLLAGGYQNICCVGDDDQSIYGWRGAEISNILQFEKDFKGADVIRLEQNYRSTGHILAAASAVIAHNTSRLGKTLWSDGQMGDKITVTGVWDGESEARSISDRIEGMKARGAKLSSIAILVRAGFQMREFEDRFLQIGMPYRVFGGPRFYERAEIRDALAYFRMVVQPQDDLALERIINVPKRGIGDAALKDLRAHAKAKGTSLFGTMEDLIAGMTLKGKQRETYTRFVNDMHRWRGLLSGDQDAEVAAQILDESGYMAMWQADKSPDAPTRLDNLKELVGTMQDYPSMAAFLEHVALVMDNAQNAQEESVSIMTLHAAKGLEYDTVFLPGFEEGIFPSGRSMDENGIAGLEEERRLAYVGLTRARARVFISCAGSRRQYGNWVQNMPSRFIGEIPDDHKEVEGQQGTAFRPADTYGTSSASPFRSSASTRVIDVDDDGRKNVDIDHPPAWSRDPSSRYNQTEARGSRYDERTPYQKPASALVPPPSDGLTASTRVRHAEFGDGTIIHRAGNKLDIRFQDGKMRRILIGFVEKV